MPIIVHSYKNADRLLAIDAPKLAPLAIAPFLLLLFTLSPLIARELYLQVLVASLARALFAPVGDSVTSGSSSCSKVV